MASFVWKSDNGRYGHGEYLYVGKWRMGWAGYNLSRRKSDPDTTAYRATSSMPGLVEMLGTYATVAEAKARVEAVAKKWLEGLNG